MIDGIDHVIDEVIDLKMSMTDHNTLNLIVLQCFKSFQLMGNQYTGDRNKGPNKPW